MSTCITCGGQLGPLNNCYNRKPYSIRYESSRFGEVIQAHNDAEAIDRALRKSQMRNRAIESLSEYGGPNLLGPVGPGNPGGAK